MIFEASTILEGLCSIDMGAYMYLPYMNNVSYYLAIVENILISIS
jgi:hypothetical protein